MCKYSQYVHRTVFCLSKQFTTLSSKRHVLLSIIPVAHYCQIKLEVHTTKGLVRSTPLNGIKGVSQFSRQKAGPSATGPLPENMGTVVLEGDSFLPLNQQTPPHIHKYFITPPPKCQAYRYACPLMGFSGYQWPVKRSHKMLTRLSPKRSSCSLPSRTL